MRIDGEWLICDDGVVRPVIRAEVLGRDGMWRAAEFLLDTGADCTVLSAPVLASLDLVPIGTRSRLGGVGGETNAVVVETRIRLTREDDGKVSLRGQYAAVTDMHALDMSVLGRDVTGLFAVIVDKSANVVCMLNQRHQYIITQR